jgi:AmiR/NasT family two-component response regulator
MRSTGRRLPAVLLTALSDGSVRAASGGDAPDAILEKPFKKRGVEKALALALRSR